MVVEVNASGDDGPGRVERALTTTRAALAQIGLIVQDGAQEAFQKQALGPLKWLSRYPGQPAPKVNIAGLVSDFARGRTTPPERRFRDRPAGVDEGSLAGSISYVVASDHEVQVGSDVPHAGRIQHGGKSSQEVTPEVKTALRGWLGTERGQPYAARLGFLFSETQHETRVAARPFLGITSEMEADIVEAVESHFAREMQE